MSDAVARAETAIDLHQYEIAQQILIDALAADPENAELWETFARLKLQEGDHSEAKRFAEGALRFDPDSATAYLVLGWATLQMNWPDVGLDPAEIRNRTRRCHELVDRALELAPFAPQPFALKATLYQLVDRHEKALEQANAGLSLDPHFAPCALVASESLYALNRIEEAGALSKQHLAFDAEDASMHHQLAKVELKQGNYGVALLHARQALKLSPEDASYRQTFWDAVTCQYPIFRLAVKWQRISLKLQQHIGLVLLFLVPITAGFGAFMHIKWDIEGEVLMALLGGLCIALIMSERPFQGIIDWWLSHKPEYREMLDPIEVRNGLLMYLGIGLLIFVGVMLLVFNNVMIPGLLAAIAALLGIVYTLRNSSWSLRAVLLLLASCIAALMTYAIRGLRWHAQDRIKPLRYIYSVGGALFLGCVYIVVYLQSLDNEDQAP